VVEAFIWGLSILFSMTQSADAVAIKSAVTARAERNAFIVVEGEVLRAGGPPESEIGTTMFRMG
jgi:hypothetical protein